MILILPGVWGRQRPQETTKPEEFVIWYQITCLLPAISDLELRNFAFELVSTNGGQNG